MTYRHFPRRRFLATGAASLAGMTLVSSPARAAEFQLKVGTDIPPDNPIGVGAADFAAGVQRASGGRIEMQIFPNSILGGDSSMMQQVRIGAIDLFLTSGDLLASVVPVAGIERLGFAFPDTKTGLSAMNGDLGALIRKELAAKGFIGLPSYMDLGFRQITTGTHPIRNVDDLSGLKIRVPAAAIASDLFKTLGASPTPIDASGLYTALQTHVVDAMEGNFANIYSLKMYEVQQYLSVTNHQWNGYWVIMNPASWNRLPSDLQDLMQRSEIRSATVESANAERSATSFADKLKSLGMKTNVAEVGSFRRKLGDYYTRWKNEFGSTAWSALEKYVGKLG